MSAEIIYANWFDERFYRIKKNSEEHYIASVTTKLGVERKFHLERWIGEVGWERAQSIKYESSERGKRIHFALSTYLTGGTVIFNDWRSPLYTDNDIKEMQKEGFVFVLKDQGEMLDIWKLQQFFDLVKPKILHSEKIVYSIERDIAGTLDIAMEIEKGVYVSGSGKNSTVVDIPETGVYIADLKTGKTVEDSVWRQLAPYALSYEEMGLGSPSGCLVLHSGATTEGGIPGLSVKLATRDELPPYLEDYEHLAAIWKRNNPNKGPVVFKFPSKIKKEN